MFRVSNYIFQPQIWVEFLQRCEFHCILSNMELVASNSIFFVKNFFIQNSQSLVNLGSKGCKNVCFFAIFWPVYQRDKRPCSLKRPIDLKFRRALIKILFCTYISSIQLLNFELYLIKFVGSKYTYFISYTEGLVKTEVMSTVPL